MKIAVNIQPMLAGNKSGIGYYQSEMLRGLLSQDRENCYILNYFDLKNNKNALVEKYLSGGNVVKDCCKWFSATLYQMIWSVFPLPYRIFFRSKPDISVFFNYYLPPFARGKKVLVIYDTVIKDYPETVRLKTKIMLKLTLKASIRRADKIITISEFSKKQIIKHYDVDENKIAVIPCAADRKKYRPMNDGDPLIGRVKDKYGISGDYFLYLGTLEPRKNITGLITAYSEALKKKPDLPKLVIAGGKGWMYEEIFSKVTELKCEENIIFTGYVDDGDVPVLMNGAKAFCFPSFYEGFGMPPLEAMSCGIPVIVSDCTSLPEVVGECGIKVDPYSVEDMAEALVTACGDDFAREQSRMGIERASHFSWEKSAEMLKGIFEELYNEQAQNTTDK